MRFQAKQLSRNTVTRLDAYIERTLQKAGAVNKPYKAIKQTDEYKEMQELFESGISKQGKHVADELDKYFESASIDDTSGLLTLDEEQKLTGIVSKNMPELSDFVTEFQVFQQLKGFFEWSVVQQYKRWGYMAKADSIVFSLSNTFYINQLKDRSAYLLNGSSLDQTTLDDVIKTISEGRLSGLTNSEVAQLLSDSFDDISRDRGEMIARTESANAIGDANHASAKENGAPTHEWVCAGGKPDELCQSNEDEGLIPIDQSFSSGDLSEPAHPNCECYTQAGEIDLDSIDIWTGE